MKARLQVVVAATNGRYHLIVTDHQVLPHGGLPALCGAHADDWQLPSGVPLHLEDFCKSCFPMLRPHYLRKARRFITHEIKETTPWTSNRFA